MKIKHVFAMALLGIATLLNAAPQIQNVTAKQRFPWNGKVDINYTLTGDLTAGVPSWNIPRLFVTASNRVDGATYTAEASALSGDTGTVEGAHHVIWDLNAQGLEIKSDEVVFTVAYATAEYCVIDLSGGANAASYPVTYLADVPSGGWSDEYKTTKLVLRLIAPGTFMMRGSYQVTLTKPFYCGVFEVTQKQYELVTGSNPSSYTGDMRPVECVSWNTIRGNSSTYNWPSSANVDSNSFVGRLQARTGLNFDLPTEAQWEYACRAGTTSKYNNGGDTENDLRELGRYCDDRSDGKGGYSQHTTVGSYQPNAWGLYDMHVNVWEWCLDWYGRLSSGVTDPVGSCSGSARVRRGGGWDYDAGICSSSYRGGSDPSNDDDDIGFRLVRTLSSTESERSPEAVAGAERADALCAAEAAPVAIDSRVDMEPVLESVVLPWNAEWIGGDANATVVIADNGTEVKRATGAGEFTHTLTGDGRHELTYTTYIGGVAQDEIYTATVFKNLKCNISDVTARQRYPWNGKMDITYNLTVDVTAGISPDAEIALLVTASNRVDGATYTAEASALSGDTGTAEGAHHVVWDLNAQGLEIKSDEVVFTVAYNYYEKYCVIDLSGGANAASYPVSYVASVPSGGFNTDEYKTTKLVLRLVEPGTFMMNGSYQVTLTKPFYCGVFEVTQKQYELVTGDKPSYFNNASCYATRPVEKVSYNMIRGSTAGAGWPGSSAVDGNSFLGKLQARTGLNFDLPTEAQWEYACRAGTTTDYNSGKNNTGSTCANMNEVGRYWYNGGQNYSQSGDVSSGTAKVGSYQPNAWGLYDMHGNVWEWCLDWNGSLSSGATDPLGSSSGSYRVSRGGCWDSHADGCTSSYRSSIGPSDGYNVYGFRLVRTLSNTEGERSPEAVAGAERADALCAAEAAPVAIDSRVDMEPVLESVVLPWNAEWIGGDANATVVIADNGNEVKRTTGAGEFTLTGDGRHDLTYTTYIDGVAQDEVYTATVFKEWKYEVVDGGAFIVATTHESGDVTIPAVIDGYQVTGIDANAFSGCSGLTRVYLPQDCAGSTSAFPESASIVRYAPRQTVTFDVNGGGDPVSSVEVEYGKPYGSLQTPSRSGYSFEGWTLNEEFVSADTIVTALDDHTLVAQWTVNKYRISFSSNYFNEHGGMAGVEGLRDYGSEMVAPTFTRIGYTFAGWSPALPATVPAENVTYEAQWTINQYTVTFDANGGEGGETATLDYGTEIVAPTVTRIGYTFAGWSPAVAATVPAENVTYTAQWTINKYAVAFDANGGYGEMANQTIAIDEEAALAANVFKRMGFEFLGWSGTPSGDREFVDGQSVMNLTTRPNATVVLYAVWRLVSPMPQVGNDADVGVVMGNAPASLKENVTNLAEYNAYRTWADGKAEEAAAVSSPNGWLSFALDADKLIEKELTQDDVEVTAFEPTGTAGAYALEVSLKDIEVGDAADGGRLATVFGLEGSTTLELDSFSSENVTLEASEPVGGKVRLTAKPMPKTPANAFFMRVKLKK